MKKIFLIFFMIFIFLIKVSAYDFGEEVKYNGIKFNVLKDNGDSVTLLKKTPLQANDLNNFGYGHVNEYTSYKVGYPDPVTYTKEAVVDYAYGGIAYYSSSDCTNIGDKNFSGCNSNYDESEVKYVVDSYGKNLAGDDLRKDSMGYEVRLLTKEEIEENFNFEYVYKTPSDANMTFCATENTPNWIFNGDFWLMSPSDDSNKVYCFSSNFQSLYSYYVYANLGVRPVITIDKNALSKSSRKEFYYNKDNIKDILNRKYMIEDVIYYNETKFYVIYNLNTDREKTITLLKAEPLTVDEVNLYGVGHINVFTSTPNTVKDIDGYGGVAYYTSSQCNTGDNTSCTNEYDKSEIKYIVDNWKEDVLSVTFVLIKIKKHD